jgi:SAM-dependent methyltransferase
MTTTIVGCRSCGSTRSELVLSLGDTPLTAAFLTDEQLTQPEPRYPLDVAVCPDCSLMQVMASVPPEVIFCNDYPYYSSFSDTLLSHSRANAEHLIAARSLGPDSLVLELASNDGYMLRYFHARGIPVLGIDPAEGPARAAIEAGIPTRCRFFGKDLAHELRAEGKSADVVIANNVLAHVPDLNGFVEGINVVLKADGVAVIEVPYAVELVESCEFDTIYHEHLCYFSVTALVPLFQRQGLTLNRIEHFPIHGGTIRLYVSRDDCVDESVSDALARERALGVDGVSYYQGFAARVAGIKHELTSTLTDLKRRGASIAAYGAAAKGCILLNYAAIGTDVIDFVVDRNPHKQGMYMPGVHIPVRDPSELLVRSPDFVLLLAWNFKDEVLRQQAEYRRRGGKFIVPIPRLAIA